MSTLASQAAEPAAAPINSGGIRIFGAVQESSAGNLCLSPFSIQSALAMTYAGASGGTAAQMREVLAFPEDPQELAAGFQALNQALEQAAARSGEDTSLRVANRLFGAKGFAFRPAFLELCKTPFGAPLEAVDFRANPAAAARLINAWVEEKTARRIRDLIPAGALSEKTTLVLANALYLKIPWSEEFSKAGDIAFTTGAGGKVEAPAIRRTDSFRYEKQAGFTAVGVPFRGGQFQFLILLPDPGADMPALTADLLAACAKLPTARVDLTLPKFRLEPPTLPLGETLQRLGMKAAFDIPRGSADFDAMAPRRPDDYLAISDVFHKTFFALDEMGVEAAAATAVVMMRMSAMPVDEKPVEVVVDRPFLFAVQHVDSGACLFLGRLVDPR